MRCRNCKHNGFLVDEDGTPYQWCRVVSDNLDPDEERQCRHYATATHADQLRAMTDEELAVWIAGGVLNLTGGSLKMSAEAWLDWLRQEAAP